MSGPAVAGMTIGALGIAIQLADAKLKEERASASLREVVNMIGETIIAVDNKQTREMAIFAVGSVERVLEKLVSELNAIDSLAARHNKESAETKAAAKAGEADSTALDEARAESTVSSVGRALQLTRELNVTVFNSLLLEINNAVASAIAKVGGK